MTSRAKTFRPVASAQRGAAMVVGLLLLMVLTVFAVSSMGFAAMDLAISGNTQYQNRAFQAADSLLQAELLRVDIVPLSAPGPLPDLAANVNRVFLDNGGQNIATASATTSYEATAALSGWQIGGGGGFIAHHFRIEAQATSTRGASATHAQGYYLIGPAGAGP